MKKIALFFPSFDVGGVEKVMIAIANRLHDLQFEVIIIAKDKGVLRNLLNEDIKVIDLGNRRIRTSLFFLRNVLKSNKIESLISGPDFCNYVAVIAKLLLYNKVHLIITQHSYFNVESKRLGFHGRITPLLIKLLYNKANVIVAVSDGVKNMLENMKLPVDKVHRIYNPIDLDTIQRMACEYVLDLPTSKYIIYLGRLAFVKNLSLMLNSFALFHKSNPEYKLLILGDGDQFEKLTLQVEELELSDSIIWGGKKLNPYPYLKQASFLVLSSISESFGNVVVEAMSLGITVVSTPTAGVLEVDDSRGVVYFSDSLLNEKKLCDRMKYAALHPISPDKLKKRAAVFNVVSIVDEYIRLL